MAFNEAFNVVPEGEGAKLAVSKGPFKEGSELDSKVEDRLDEVQKKLDEMQKTMKEDLNADELKVASLAIERELENSIPGSFKKEYEQSETWSECADLVTQHILENVNSFAINRLKKVIDAIDSESWTGSVDKDEVADILREIDPGISDEEVEALQNRYSSPSLLEQAPKNIQNRYAQIDEVMKMR